MKFDVLDDENDVSVLEPELLVSLPSRQGFEDRCGGCTRIHDSR